MSTNPSNTHAASEKQAASHRKVAAALRAQPAVVQPGTLQRTVADPGAARPADMLMLQRRYGNEAVQSLLARHAVQAKLNVGPAGDAYEQEADRVADQVMVMPAPQPPSYRPAVQRAAEAEDEPALQTKPLAASITPLVQRAAEEEVQTKPLLQRAAEEEEVQTKPLIQRAVEEEDAQAVQTKPLVQRAAEVEEVQTKPLVQRQAEEEDEIQTKPQDPGAGFEAGRGVEDQLRGQKGSGSPLPGDVRAYMEPRFGADFSGVRVHTGGEAAQLNRQLSAQAFTHGQDIYMGDGKYDPASADGKHLLAHELTHTIQQTGRIQPRIQRWSVGGWFAKKGHESITADSVEQWNRQALRDGRPDQMISDKDKDQLIKGSRWNDLLGHYGVVTMGLALIGSKKSLTHQSHEGQLQFLHGMASEATESVWKTQHKIMTWAKFCYLVGTGAAGYEATNTLSKVPNDPPSTEFSGNGVSIPELFERWGGKTIAWLFSDSDKTDPAAIKMRAIGSMMHMLQDTFCVSHVQRVAAKGDEEFRRIRGFNVYTEQSASIIGGLFSKWKNRHGMADKLRDKEVTKTAGATEAADVGMEVLKYLKTGKGWDVVEVYLKKVFALEAERQPKPEGGERPEAPKISASGRLFRKTWLSDEFKAASSAWGRTRPSDFKALDKMLGSYVLLLKEDLNNMTRHQMPAQKEVQLKMEQSTLQTIVDIISLIKEQHAKAPDKTMAKRLPALDALLSKVQEDLNEVNSDLASVEKPGPLPTL